MVVKNRNFSKEIAIGELVYVDADEIDNDFEFEFSYFSFRKERHKGEFDIKLKEFGHYSESEIPITTKTNVHGCEELYLQDNTRYFIFTTWTSRTTKLVVIKPVSKEFTKNKSVFFFTDPSDKRSFLLRMAFQSIITLAIATMLFPFWGAINKTWKGYIFPVLVFMAFFVSGFRKLCYFFATMFWKIRDKAQSNQ